MATKRLWAPALEASAQVKHLECARVALSLLRTSLLRTSDWAR